MLKNSTSAPLLPNGMLCAVHPCSRIYELSNKPIYGDVEGVCRITGQQGKGLLFKKWVKDTFTAHHLLRPGTIISNEALLCFSELSPYIQELTGKEKPQNFRSYSHFVLGDKWYLKHKGQKEEMLTMMLQLPDVCVISESGQKHLLFQHVCGTWQFEETMIQPDVTLFQTIHQPITTLAETFSNDEIKSGQYLQYRIIKFGLKNWQQQEDILKQYRGSAMFDLALFFSKIKYNYE